MAHVKRQDEQHGGNIDAEAEMSAREIKALLDKSTKGLAGAMEPLQFTLGVLLLCIIIFSLGSCPWALPYLYLGLACVGLPWRAWTYVRRGYGFFLIDFCYFANAAVILWLLFGTNSLSLAVTKIHNKGSLVQKGCPQRTDNHPTPFTCPQGPQNPGSSSVPSLHYSTSTSAAGIQAAVYSLAEGPLAAALIAWQCAWVLGSVEHTTSVLVHLLPGLVMYSLHHLSSSQRKDTNHYVQDCCLVLLSDRDICKPGCDSAACSDALLLPHIRGTWSQVLTWHLAVPILGYLVWQFLYWFVVQVFCLKLITKKGYDTSYRALARRAAKANNWIHRFVRRGSINRRIVLFGVFQFAFTVATLAVALVTYYSPILAAIWQVVKLTVPLYYGATYQLQQLPQKGVRKGVRRLSTLGLASSIFLFLVDEEGAYSDNFNALTNDVHCYKDGVKNGDSKISRVDVNASALLSTRKE
ncbi:hypothetical protein CEUSTIGMA_g2620.t1 [Chlamydomonas eustigma]|uniref:Glycerophosphocholine acyltransferase 1 n=1 Tax=Chlamydomonas eustigma TaxID=1157962 RepID=A0A250WWN4_9CHLO|nr:hypothetical protein CEUSTIGMA_g2620.t1 [Chlamydomonas eustigma]|eukprot:GAX75176.1 hypothetical protein CEUSTIGMA_g2620.t1 [Chlamydomonas eustigma]